MTSPGTGKAPPPLPVSPLRWIVASLAGGAVGWLVTLGLVWWISVLGFASALVGLAAGTVVAGLVIRATTPSRWVLAGLVAFVTFTVVVYVLVFVVIASGAFVVP